MSDGFTYPTRSQAEIVAKDLREEGNIVTILDLPRGEAKVVITKEFTPEARKRRLIMEEGILGVEEEDLTPEEAIAKKKKQRETQAAVKKEFRTIEEKEAEEGALRRAKIARGTKRKLEAEELAALKRKFPGSQAKWYDEYQKRLTRLSYKAWLEEKPEQREADVTLKVREAGLVERKQELGRLIAERIRKGHADPGVIVPVFDPQTRQIVDYKLEIRGTEQRLREKIEKGVRQEFRTAEKQIDIKEAGIRTLGTTLGSMGSVRKGMTASIPGQASTPKALIAALPQRQEGVIGTERPAISRIGTPGMEEANNLGIKARGFGAPPSESSLRVTPKTERITANGTKEIGAGFAGMFMKKIDKEQEV